MNVNNNYATDHGNSHPIGYAVYLSGVIPAGIYEVDNNREMLKSHFRIAGLYVSVNKQTLYVPFPWLSEISYGANDVTHQNSTLEFDYYLPSGTKYGIAFKVSTSLDLDTSTVMVMAEGQVTRQPMVHNIEDLDEIAGLATMQASGFDYDFAKVQGSEKYITDGCNKTIVKVVNTWFNSVGISFTSIVNEHLKLAYKYVTPKLTTLFVKEMIKAIHVHTSSEGFGGIFFGRVGNPEPLTGEACSRLVAASHVVLVKIGKHPVYNSSKPTDQQSNPHGPVTAVIGGDGQPDVEMNKNRQQDSYVLDQVAASVPEAGTKFPFNEEPSVLKKPTVVWTSENGKVIVPTIATKVPKSTVDSILATVKLQFHRFPGTNGVIAVAHLPDGFIVSTGVGSCVHGPNFNEAAGIEAATEQAMRKAEDKIWEMQGTLLREQIMENIKQQGTVK